MELATSNKEINRIQRETEEENQKLIENFNNLPFWKRWGRSDELRQDVINNWRIANIKINTIMRDIDKENREELNSLINSNMKLKIGDKIFLRRYGKLIGFTKIISVKKTIAKSRQFNFEIDVRDTGHCIVKGAEMGNSLYGELATTELEAEYHRAKKIKWVDNKIFTDEEKIKIYNSFN